LKILSGAEQMLFDRPPHLSAAERRQFFEPPASVRSVWPQTGIGIVAYTSMIPAPLWIAYQTLHLLCASGKGRDISGRPQI
jgi:hypothetical protein